MAFKTQPALVSYGDWNETTRAHPAMQWMEKYTNKYDEGLAVMEGELDKWHAKDFVYVKSDGTVFNGAQQGFDALKATYGFFSKYHHEPFYVVCHESENGYEMIGQAKLFFNLQGGSGTGVTDGKGQSWEMSLPGAFKFEYVKDPSSEGGFLLKKTEIMSDSAPVVVKLLQSGALKPSDLGM